MDSQKDKETHEDGELYKGICLAEDFFDSVAKKNEHQVTLGFYCFFGGWYRVYTIQFFEVA